MSDRPDLSALVQIASSSANTREKVLMYIQENVEELLKAETSFNIQKVDVPFIPVLVRRRPTTSSPAAAKGEDKSLHLQRKGDEDVFEIVETVAAPRDCYLKDSPFGFPCVIKRYENLAKRLGIILRYS